jgi:hypothetical protein
VLVDIGATNEKVRHLQAHLEMIIPLL